MRWWNGLRNRREKDGNRLMLKEEREKLNLE